MIRIFPLVFVIICAIGISSPRAQDSPDEVNYRASHLIDTTMSTLNVRFQRFNEELEKINAVKPLDVDSTTLLTVPMKRTKIKDFLNYLEVFRGLSTRLKQEIVDSVETLKKAMPSHHRAGYLQDFLDAYVMDQSAFNKYTIAVTKLFGAVDQLLLFLGASHTKVIGNKLEFTDKKEYDEYSKLFDEIEKNNKKLISASANSQKAKIDAGALMRKAYSSLQK